MKLRTSSSERYLLGKDLTRFAPVWGGYLLCLVLGTVLLAEGNLSRSFIRNLAELPNLMALVNLGYGLLTAQVLFGDLFKTRMCYALHAMPLRREKWLSVHFGAGLLFSLIPTAIITALWLSLALTVCSMVNGWQLCLYVFAAMNLQYLFFFSLGVLCACCAGSRAGMTLLYAIANFLSYLLYFLVDTVYVPMLQGVVTVATPFIRLCPVVNLSALDLFAVESHWGWNGDPGETYFTFTLAEGWGYLLALAGVAAVCMALALWMYRRRRLETAGDILATRKIELPFMVLLSLCAGAVFHGAQSIFVGNQRGILFLFIGVAAGWFAGRMLIERQVNVFRRGRNWAGMALMLGCLALSLFLNRMDLYGIQSLVPRADQVRSVELTLHYNGRAIVEDPEAVEDMLTFHRAALEAGLTGEAVDEEYQSAFEIRDVEDEYGVKYTERVQIRDYRRAAELNLYYTLENGREIRRRYWIWTDTPEGELAAKYLSTPQAIFHNEYGVESEADLEEFVRQPRSIYVDGLYLPREQVNAEQVRLLLAAFLADCREGTMVQDGYFHPGYVLQRGEHRNKSFYLSIHYAEQTLSFQIYADSRNCLAWLEEMDLMDQLREEYIRQTEN